MTAVPPADLAVEQLRRLHRAQRLITDDLTLSTMFARVVTAASEVVDVRYAALAALSPEGSMEHFVHVGLDDITAARLGRVPTGSALAELMQEWHEHESAIDLAVTSEPRTGPSGYLCVAVAAGDEHFGDLYVAQPSAGTFTDSDRELIDALSRSAGSTIAHARSLDRERRSAEWLHASGEVARALLAEADVDMVAEIVTRAVAAAGADYGQIAIATVEGHIEVIAAAGIGAVDQLGCVYDPRQSDLGSVIVEGRTARTADVSELLSDSFDNRHRYGPAMITPLIDAQGVRGSVMLVRVAGNPHFAGYELDQFATYAAQVALAMQFADARADAERLSLLDTRHRTARELHDVVMQRLFATGVGLNAVADRIADDDQERQLRRYVDDLDETIDEIRERVFGTLGDARTVLPTLSRFPRMARHIDRDADATAHATDNAGLGAGSPAVPSVAPATRKRGRGRRRTDWEDGTGTKRR